MAARQRAQASPEPGADPQIAEDARRAEMARSLRLWLDLQDAVCGLLDSTTVQNRNAGTPGVRPRCCTSCVLCVHAEDGVLPAPVTCRTLCVAC